MADPDRPLLADLQEQAARLRAELEQTLALRWQLARLEVQAAVGSIKRLAVGLAAAAVLALTGLPVLAVWAATLLDERLPLRGIRWLLVFGLVLLAAAALAGWLAWRHFRRRFVGLEETLEELREDLVWIREWTGRGEAEEESSEGE